MGCDEGLFCRYEYVDQWHPNFSVKIFIVVMCLIRNEVCIPSVETVVAHGVVFLECNTSTFEACFRVTCKKVFKLFSYMFMVFISPTCRMEQPSGPI